MPTTIQPQQGPTRSPAQFAPWQIIFPAQQGPETHQPYCWDTALLPPHCLWDERAAGEVAAAARCQVYGRASHKPLPVPAGSGSNVDSQGFTPAPRWLQSPHNLKGHQAGQEQARQWVAVSPYPLCGWGWSCGLGRSCWAPHGRRGSLQPGAHRGGERQCRRCHHLPGMSHRQRTAGHCRSHRRSRQHGWSWGPGRSPHRPPAAGAAQPPPCSVVGPGWAVAQQAC